MTASVVVDRAELPPLLALVLASPRDRFGVGPQVDAFLSYLDASGAEALAWRGGSGARPNAAAVCLLLPGNTAMLATADPDQPGVDAAAQTELTRAAVAALRERRPHYVQGLLELEDAGRERLLLSSGFRRLTRLAYLERSPTYPWSDPPAAGEARWTSYSEQTHGRFERVIRETYEDSLDCPELSGLRPMGDVLAAHRASGVFDPGLWSLAEVDGEDAGCILVALMPDAPLVEIVYMGLRRAFRSRGLGRMLIRRGLDQARRCKAERVTVVVDVRNTPARALYERCHFRPIVERDAYLLTLA